MNIRELMERMGIPMKKAANSAKRGEEYHSACPGCGGEDRFHVWPEQNEGNGSYWCRGCGKGGDNIQFLMDFEDLSFPEACERLGRPLPESKSLRTPVAPQRKQTFTPSVPADPAEAWAAKAGEFVSWAHRCLMRNKEQLAWLASRGISAGTAERFQLGWNPGENGKDIFRPRETWGLPPETKEDGTPKKLWLPMGIVIPQMAPCHGAGNSQTTCAVRVRIRRPDPITFGPRYYVVPGSSMGALLLDRARDRGDRRSWSVFVVVEAELDAIALWQAAGDMAGVIALGSSSTRPDERVFHLLQRSDIILNALDSDDAGEKEAWGWWADTFGASHERWPVPRGKDPGEAFADIDLRAWILAAMPTREPIRGRGPGAVPLEGPRGADPEPASPEASAQDDGQCEPEQQIGESPARTSGGAPDDLPATVAELYGLLRSAPVWIRKSGSNLSVKANEEWERANWVTARRISDLVFMDPAVGRYLDRHPASSITAKNFLP